MIFYVNRICEKSIQNLTAVDAQHWNYKKNGVTNGLTAMKEATAKILKKWLNILLQIQNNIVTSKENENRCRGGIRTRDL